MAKETKTYILFQNYPMTEGRCCPKFGSRIRVGASTLKEAIAICQRTFGKTTGYRFARIDYESSTPKGIATKFEYAPNPIVELKGRTWIGTSEFNSKHQRKYVATTSTGKNPIVLWWPESA